MVKVSHREATMCSRINQRSTPEEIAQYYADMVYFQKPIWPLKYNNAPNTKDAQVLTVRLEDGKHVGEIMRWGLLPGWCDGPSDKRTKTTFNARSETVKEKPVFRNAFKKRRCVVPLDGIYEWPLPPVRGNPARFIHRRDREPMMVAGIWETWTKGPAPLTTFSLMTCEPNDVLKSLPHDRMVVVLDRKDVDAWLDVENEGAEKLLRPCPAEWLDYYVTTGFVNKVGNEGPECIARADG
jgi:putative SOS response-associated peptidase YedK